MKTEKICRFCKENKDIALFYRTRTICRKCQYKEESDRRKQRIFKEKEDFLKNPSLTRLCYKCQEIKPLLVFSTDKYLCIGCSRENASIYQKRAKEKNKLNNKSKIYYRVAKSRAAQNKTEFSILPSDIIVNTTCPVLGIVICFNNKIHLDNSPSLDRVDNTKGYHKDNICLISNRANSIKRNGTADEHEKIARYMREFESNKNIDYQI